jgi:hypothetical protein
MWKIFLQDHILSTPGDALIYFSHPSLLKYIFIHCPCIWYNGHSLLRWNLKQPNFFMKKIQNIVHNIDQLGMISKGVDCWGTWVKVKKCSLLEDSNPYSLHSKKIQSTSHVLHGNEFQIIVIKKNFMLRFQNFQMKLKKTFLLAHVFFQTKPTYIEPNATFNLLHLLGVILRGIRWFVVSI